MSSKELLTGFLNLTIDRAPTIPKDKAIFPEITLVSPLELIEIEKKENKKNSLKGTIICKAKRCNNYLYKNHSQSNREYCSDCY